MRTETRAVGADRRGHLFYVGTKKRSLQPFASKVWVSIRSRRENRRRKPYMAIF